MQVSPSPASSSGQQRQRFWGESPDPHSTLQWLRLSQSYLSTLSYISRVIQSMLLPGKYILFRTWSWSAWGIPLAHTVQRWQGQKSSSGKFFPFGQTSHANLLQVNANLPARVFSADFQCESPSVDQGQLGLLIPFSLSLSLSLSLWFFMFWQEKRPRWRWAIAM